MKNILKSLLIVLISVVCLFGCQFNNTDKEIKVTAKVTSIEKFGHIVLDITSAEFNQKGFTLGDVVLVTVGEQSIKMPYFDGYYSDTGKPLLRGMTLEEEIAVCINYGSFKDTYNVLIGDVVEIKLVEKGGELTLQEIRSLQYTIDLDDYFSIKTYTNFRNVVLGNIKEDKLYRGASPISNRFNRASYSDDLIEAVGIKTVLNLSDTRDDIMTWIEKDDFDSPYYLLLFTTGQVKELNLAADYKEEEYGQSVAMGLTYLSNNDGPYYIHCEEGKDRAGFVCMLLEALMGATLDEIIEDYMLSFYNYYGITKQEEERYQTILEKNLLPMMSFVFEVEDFETLKSIDLETKVVDYLLSIGMEQDAINNLKENLSN